MAISGSGIYMYNNISLKKLSLHTSQMARQARAYPGLCSMKWLGVFLPPLDGMLVANYYR